MTYSGLLLLLGIMVPLPGTDAGQLRALGYRLVSGAAGINEVYQRKQEQSDAGAATVRVGVDDGTVVASIVGSAHSEMLRAFMASPPKACKMLGKSKLECELSGAGPSFSIQLCGERLLVGPAKGRERRAQADALCAAFGGGAHPPR